MACPYTDLAKTTSTMYDENGVSDLMSFSFVLLYNFLCDPLWFNDLFFYTKGH
jgi:hypothetical protein